MFNSFRRSLAAGSAVVIALLGLPAVPTADAAPAAADATRAANYLVRNLPKTADGVGASATVALGLATANDCTYAPALRTLVSQMEKGAKGYLYPGKKLNPARAANLAIAVEALGLNPRKFAGYNLVSLVTKGLPADGRIGSSDSAFSQSLGIIALDRADATIPVTLLTKLLSLQDDTGAFGYDFNGFQADPDTTGMGILALHAIGQLDPQVDAAKDWADDNQVEDGYWASYSPVDSTGLLGSALAAEGEDVATAKTWLGSVQNADGGHHLLHRRVGGRRPRQRPGDRALRHLVLHGHRGAEERRVHREDLQHHVGPIGVPGHRLPAHLRYDVRHRLLELLAGDPE